MAGARITILACVLCSGALAFAKSSDKGDSAATLKVHGNVPVDVSLGLTGTSLSNVRAMTTDGVIAGNPGMGFGLTLGGAVRVMPLPFGELQAIGNFATPVRRDVQLDGQGFAYPINSGYSIRMDRMFGLGARILFDLGTPSYDSHKGFGDRWALSLGLQGKFEGYSVSGNANGSVSAFRPWVDAGARYYYASAWNKKGIEPYVDLSFSAPLCSLKVSNADYAAGVSTMGVASGMPVSASGDPGQVAKAHAAGFSVTAAFGVRFGKVPAVQSPAPKPPVLPLKVEQVPVPQVVKVPEVKPVVQAAKVAPIEVEGLVVRFAFDKAVISTEGAHDVAAWVKAYKSIVDPAAMVLVGHADSTGGESHNDKLSLERARVVMNKLQEAGLDVSKVEISGKGYHDPLAPNGTQLGRGFNRRVELFFKASSGFRTRTKSFQEGVPDYSKDPHRPAPVVADKEK